MITRTVPERLTAPSLGVTNVRETMGHCARAGPSAARVVRMIASGRRARRRKREEFAKADIVGK
ncbi:MAG: hypothetical protein C4321_01710 [Chloroflexota bacterium]